ncbi:MAG: EF-P lysine aminoacylase EpmA [Gammaproteobacteria bacterium]|jgi:lysyl-tRNA synthetase class 2
MTGKPTLRQELEVRADALAAIRRFFTERQVLEVETPSLSATAATDPALTSLSLELESLRGPHYLQTSPEHAMKRLLAAGSGDIFQIARVYRDGELGRWHQPEFTLLEWYRVGFDEFALMKEVHELLGLLLAARFPDLPRLDLRFADAFADALGVDPLNLDPAACDHLIAALQSHGVDVPVGLTSDALIDLALSTVMVAGWPRDTAVFLYDYPASQAALAAIKPGPPPVAARFEVFVNGLELGNGFRELTDAAEQKRRFETDLAFRRANGLAEPPLDDALIAALELGLPECAGVALGVDRLIALRIGASSLADVINFPHP